MLLLIYVGVAAIVIAWLVAVVSCVKLFFLRHDEISGWEMAFNGMMWFRADTFKPVAADLHRVFRLSFMAFFVAIFLTALFAILSQM